jgi:hypothetical protein
MAAPKQQINTIGLSQRILRPGREAVALRVEERAKPEFKFIELDAKLFKGEVDLSDEVLEDSIERGELKQTIMELLAQGVARDMEEVVVNGNRASADPFLATMNGILVQATSHVGDAGGSIITKDILKDCLKMMPSQYLRDKAQMRWLTSVDAELEYRAKIADRQTPGGDRMLEEDAPVKGLGVPFQAIPLWPENMPALLPGQPAAPGQPAPAVPQDRTAMLLCNPKNIHVGVWRQVRIETFRDVRAGALSVVVTLRFDVLWADELGVVKIVNIKA